MTTNLEPDILECEVKWALGSIIMNKANGGDGIPVELFQILKDDAVKVLNWNSITSTSFVRSDAFFFFFKDFIFFLFYF